MKLCELTGSIFNIFQYFTVMRINGEQARANNFLTPEGGADLHDLLQVGVLDIFGFEKFEINSFEQLCINVANEQLHRYFNEHIFAHELRELEAEGVATANIQFEDNSPTIDMFLKRSGGKGVPTTTFPIIFHTPKAVTYHEPTVVWLFMLGHSLGRMGGFS